MTCKRCGREGCPMLLDGDCPKCWEPNRCRKCGEGIYRPAGTATDQTRHRCDNTACRHSTRL